MYFDQRIAERYETYWPDLFKPAAIEPVVAFLADLAGEGSALQLGVGTGRIALPLSQRGVRVHGIDLSPAHLGFDEYDIASQGLVSHHYWVVDGQLEIFSSPFRFVWPAELDLMARLAGMTLRERWSSWERPPFTSDSTTHISVWEKIAAPR